MILGRASIYSVFDNNPAESGPLRFIGHRNFSMAMESVMVWTVSGAESPVTRLVA